MPDPKMQKEWDRLKRNAASEVGEAEWLAEVRKMVPDGKATPEEWLEAARKATVKCPKCNGRKVYYWGAQVNGRMTHSGPCFRCNGKGRQNQEDFRRNWGHDQHIRVV